MGSIIGIGQYAHHVKAGDSEGLKVFMSPINFCVSLMFSPVNPFVYHMRCDDHRGDKVMNDLDEIRQYSSVIR